MPCWAPSRATVAPAAALGAVRASDPPPKAVAPAAECCDYCGSAAIEWRKCKLVCLNCRQINKSCADL